MSGTTSGCSVVAGLARWFVGHRKPLVRQQCVVGSGAGAREQRAPAAFDLPQRGGQAAGQLARAVHDRLQHRLHVAARLRNRARIAAVAVWRSSASCVSLNSRTFWIAITAWSAKVASKADLPLRERPFGFGHRDRADGAAVLQHGHDQQRPVAGGDGQLARRGGHVRGALHVLQVNDPVFRNGARRQVVGVHRHREQPLCHGQCVAHPVVVRDQVNDAVLHQQARAVHPVAQAHGALHDGIEDRLRVRGRAGDHLQDLGRGRLALQRFLGLVEQAHVLDRDHGLVGKGLEQLDLVAAEFAGLTAGDADHTDGLIVTEHRDERPRFASLWRVPPRAPPRRNQEALRHRLKRTGALVRAALDWRHREREAALKRLVAGRVGDREGHQMQGAIEDACDGRREAARSAGSHCSRWRRTPAARPTANSR